MQLDKVNEYSLLDLTADTQDRHKVRYNIYLNNFSACHGFKWRCTDTRVLFPPKMKVGLETKMKRPKQAQHHKVTVLSTPHSQWVSHSGCPDG